MPGARSSAIIRDRIVKLLASTMVIADKCFLVKSLLYLHTFQKIR